MNYPPQITARVLLDNPIGCRVTAAIKSPKSCESPNVESVY